MSARTAAEPCTPQRNRPPGPTSLAGASSIPSLSQDVLRFLREVRRRNVYRVAATYLVVAFVGLQVVNLLVPATTLPEWADELLIAFVIVGFPVAVVLAWAFEMTPDGVRRIRSPEGPGASWGGTWWVGVTLTLAAAAGIWWIAVGSKGEPNPAVTGADSVAAEAGARRYPARDRPFVAVLPLANMSRDRENEYFAAGTHEEILTQLAKISELGVFARTTMVRYRDTDRSVAEIGRELDAAAVLEGSVRKSGERVRITLQLIDPRSRDHLWAESYDRRLEDVFAIQTEIAGRVARALEARLSPDERERIAARPTESSEAYELYLRGRTEYNRYEEAANGRAIRLFREAVAIDSGFAPAWAGLGEALARKVGRFGDPRAWADSAVRAARTSLELNGDLAEAHRALGYAYRVQGRLREALTSFRTAARLEPNDAAAVQSVGQVVLLLGRYDEAVRWYRRSARLEPDNASPRRSLAYAYTHLGMDRDAGQWLEDALRLAPESVHAQGLAIQLAVYRGDREAALREAERSVRRSPDDALAWTQAAGGAYMVGAFDRSASWARESLQLAPDNELVYWHYTGTLLGLSLIQSSQEQAGRKILENAIEENRRRLDAGVERPTRWDLAAAHAALGEQDQAFDWLERAYQAGFRHPRWLRVDPAFGPFRDHLRYRKILTILEDDMERMRQRLRRSAGEPP